MSLSSKPDTVDGEILEDTIVEPGSACGHRLTKVQRLRVIDPEGQQAVDFRCYSGADPSDRYNPCSGYNPTPVRIIAYDPAC